MILSYCVHCGVELADYETKCPLCETPVVDPSRPIASGEAPFPDRIEEGRKINKHFIVTLVSIVMLIPFIVTTLIDVTLSAGMSWSAYVLGAEALFWLAFVLPFQSRGTSPYLFCFIDTAATALYVLLIAVIEGGRRWYVPLALPLILAAGLEAVVMTAIYRSARIGKLTKAGLAFLAISFYPLIVDIAVAHYSYGSFLPRWSWYASVPLFVFGLTVVILSMNRRFRVWLRKKMFI